MSMTINPPQFAGAKWTQLKKAVQRAVSVKQEEDQVRANRTRWEDIHVTRIAYIDGRVVGNVHGGLHAVIGCTGIVDKDVLAERVTVRGIVKGNVTGKHIRIKGRQQTQPRESERRYTVSQVTPAGIFLHKKPTEHYPGKVEGAITLTGKAAELILTPDAQLQGIIKFEQPGGRVIIEVSASDWPKPDVEAAIYRIVSRISGPPVQYLLKDEQTTRPLPRR